MVLLACSVRTGLFMTSDGCGILLTNVGNSLITCSSRWTPHKMIRMEHCSSALHLQKSCSNHGQTHRGSAIVEDLHQTRLFVQIVFVHSGLDLRMPQAWRKAVYSHSLLASDRGKAFISSFCCPLLRCLHQWPPPTLLSP